MTSILIVAAATCVAAPALGQSSASAPSSSQIRKAVRQAKQSPNLWATVNVCNTARHRHVIGIRGQIPALSFGSHLLLDIQVLYKSSQTMKPVQGAERVIDLGTQSKDLFQGGYNFQFAKHAGLLRGTVTFLWKLHGHVIGTASRLTTGGHSHVDFGDPAGYSRASCRIR